MNPFLPLAMALTDLGESSILLSTAVAASGWFWLSRQRPLALLWLSAVGGCALTMLALKLVFLTCGQYVLAGTVESPSGHSSMSALFYGAAALTLTKLSPQAARHRFLLLGCAVAMALAIGASRIVVNAHTPQEVVIGLAIGFTWLGLFALLLPRTGASVAMPPAAMQGILVLLYGGLLLVTLAGEHISVEDLLFRVADYVHVHWGVCTA
jgi:membrane-associated phospholipid phosphatase